MSRFVNGKAIGGYKMNSIRPIKDALVPSRLNLEKWIREPLVTSRRWRETYRMYKELKKSKRLSELLPKDHSDVLKIMTEYPTVKTAAKRSRMVLDGMHTMKVSLTMLDLEEAMTIYLKAGWRNGAIDIFDGHKGSNPSIRAYTLLMSAYSDIGDVKSVIETWAKLIHCWPQQLYTNTDAWALVIRAYGLDGKMDECISHFKFIQSKEKTLTFGEKLYLYEALITSFGKNDMLKEAEVVFHSLELDSGSYATNSEKFDSFFYIYDSMIETCISCNERIKVELYFKELQEVCNAIDKSKGREVRTGEYEISDSNYQQFNKHLTPLPKTLFNMIAYYSSLKLHSDVLNIYGYYYGLVKWDKESCKRVAAAFIAEQQEQPDLPPLSHKSVYHAMRNRFQEPSLAKT